MKVLLMQPIIEFVKEPPDIPDLGLGYIASSLKNNGHNVYIMDWNMRYTPENFRKWLIENQPDTIGIKIFTKDVGAAKKTITMVKETLPDSIIVIGGPHPSSVDPVELIEDFALCDFAIKGEAEISLPPLLAAISKAEENTSKYNISQEKALKIPGLVWRDKERTYSNPISLIHDLNSIDFPYWEMFNPNNYNINMLGSTIKEGNTAPIITTRGCPGKCSFCSAFNVSGRKIRTRSSENVFAEMSLLHNRYSVKKFMFQDNCFTSIKENVIRLCELIMRESIKIEWDCVSYERLDNLTDETLSAMYRAGCRMIHIGIESGSEKTRKIMNKWGSLTEIDEKVKVIRKKGIKVGAWFMLGFPEETKDDMNETVRYAFSLSADLLTFTICFPLPGSQVYHYIKEKYKFEKIDWSNFDIYNSPFPVSDVSSKQLTRLLKAIRFRLRINRRIKRFKSLVGLQ